MTQQSYTLVQDFLFTEIFIENANSYGVLASMTIDSETTVKKYYLLTEKKTKESVETSKELGALMRCHNKKHSNADGNTTGESSKKDDEDRDSDGTAKELQIKRFYALTVI